MTATPLSEDDGSEAGSGREFRGLEFPGAMACPLRTSLVEELQTHPEQTDETTSEDS